MFITQHLKWRRGFTLIEVLISLVVIGILSGTMMLTVGSGSDKARATRIVSDMKTLSRAAQMAYADGLSLGPDVTFLSPYVADNLDEQEKYSLVAQGGYLFVKTDLSDYGEGIRSRLSSGADDWNLWQAIGEDSADTYADAGSVFLPVNLAASETAPVLAYYFGPDEEHDSLPSGWSVEDGVLKDDGSGSYYFGENDWVNYEITANVTLGQKEASGDVMRANSGYGIYFHTQVDEDGNAQAGYRLQFDKDHMDFEIQEVGEYKAIEGLVTDFPEDFDVNASHEVTITSDSGTFVIEVDGTQVMEFNDSDYLNMGSGGTGLRVWGGQGLDSDSFIPTEFDSIVVTPLD